MPLTLVDQGESILLDLILAGNLTLRLFTNNITPAETDTELAMGGTGALAEPSAGYAAKTLTSGNWTKAGTAPTEATYNAAQVFTFTGAAGPIYGYSIHRASDNKLLWLEKFSAAYSAVTNGDHLDVTPKFNLS